MQAHISLTSRSIKPIKAFLSGKGRVCWTEACTAVLNDKVRCIYTRVRLVPTEPYGQLVIYPSKQDSLGFVACLQGGATVVFVLSALTNTNMKLGVLSQLIVVIAWAVWQLRHYTMFAEEILVVLPNAKSVVVMLDSAMHLCMHAHVLDLQQYVVRWTQGDNPWAIMDAESLVTEHHALLPGVQVPVVEHHDVKLQLPASHVKDSEKELSASGWILQFDG